MPERDVLSEHRGDLYVVVLVTDTAQGELRLRGSQTKSRDISV